MTDIIKLLPLEAQKNYTKTIELELETVGSNPADPYGDDLETKIIPSKIAELNATNILLITKETRLNELKAEKEYKELKPLLDKFISEGSTFESWIKIFGEPKNGKHDAYGPYIYRKNQKFTVSKMINGKQRTFGNCSTLEKAKLIRDFLEYHEWDLQYLPINIVGKNKTVTDEYYLSILPFMMDEDFERWRALRNLGEK